MDLPAFRSSDRPVKQAALGQSHRVFIAMSDTGGGHRSVSNAIARALDQLCPGRVETTIVDAFALAPLSLGDRITRLYGTVTRIAPWVYGSFFHLTNQPLAFRALWATSSANTAGKLRRAFESFRPTVVVSVHPLTNHSIFTALKRYPMPIRTFAAVTELVTVHASWVDRRFDLFNTATVESYRNVLRLGAPAERVRCVGLPIDPRFGQVPADRAALRATLSLDPRLFTVLIVGGGEGVGGLDDLVRVLDAARLPIQLVVVCGRNAPLRARLEAFRLGTPARIVGYATNMPDLMHAADVFVGKGGPTTIAEALAAGCPIILTQTLPGQEEGNNTFVESRGAGFAAHRSAEVVEHVARLARDPAEARALGANARRAGRPDAAREVARLIVALGRDG